MADEKAVLKDKKDELEALTERLVAEHLASAAVRAVLAPLEQEIALLEEKVAPKKSAKKDKE